MRKMETHRNSAVAQSIIYLVTFSSIHYTKNLKMKLESCYIYIRIRHTVDLLFKFTEIPN